MNGQRSPQEVSDAAIRDCLRRVIADFPESFRTRELAHLDRYALNVRLVFRHGGHLIDLGCGTGAFPVACAHLGMRVTAIDEWLDPTHLTRDGRGIVELYCRSGIEVIRSDLLSFRFPGIWQSTVDVVSCFESMEHWPASPKSLFCQVAQALKPGGRIVLSVPNAVAAHNRILVLLGRTNYGPWSDFYHSTTHFRGHIREPVVSELLDMIRYHGLNKVQVLGKYWLPQRLPARLGLLTRAAETLLARAPTLCGSLYIVAEKPLADETRGTETSQ